MNNQDNPEQGGQQGPTCLHPRDELQALVLDVADLGLGHQDASVQRERQDVATAPATSSDLSATTSWSSVSGTKRKEEKPCVGLSGPTRLTTTCSKSGEQLSSSPLVHASHTAGNRGVRPDQTRPDQTRPGTAPHPGVPERLTWRRDARGGLQELVLLDPVFVADVAVGAHHLHPLGVVVDKLARGGGPLFSQAAHV
ncbi:LOW QUALITY PROTEIN: hypothetical protein CRUP_008251 [Coryphaenoides rupestris]|nr:LOW QUALITY PROTEIN: hypothetical protein CRUP_008251 [Coryphaenoides rupestris]